MQLVNIQLLNDLRTTCHHSASFSLNSVVFLKLKFQYSDILDHCPLAESIKLNKVAQEKEKK